MMTRKGIEAAVALCLAILAMVLILAFARPRMAGPIADRRQKAAKEREMREKRPDSLFAFDPNTVTYEQLLSMGFRKSTAVGIVKYRAAGKVFAIREDFALCYGVTDSMYARLKPYIHIGEQYRATLEHTFSKDSTRHASDRFIPRPAGMFRIDTVGTEYLRTIGFSTRQARALIKYRDRGGIRDMNELRDCYAVSSEMADSLERYVIFPEIDPHEGLVEINSADSAALRSVAGIGAKTVVAVMEYRRLLGGFYSTKQIAELKCVTDENFALISQQIYCDSCNISKIDVNFAPASVLERHPYFTREAIERITEHRKSKGGWNCVEEMIDDKILGREQATALAPYLHFGTSPLDFE